jgi:phosphatidylethanolamine/phosphatidyl-N-methylethanolamine N-methyltransferase
MNLNLPTKPQQTGGEIAFFLRRWLANPRRVGAIMPSAPALTRRMAREVRLHNDDDVVVELGPGTGAVTRALIQVGVPEGRLVLVERDPKMCAFLRRRFPLARLIQGDAGRLEEVLPARWHGRVSTVVSSLPLVSLPRGLRDDIVNGAFRVMSDRGRFVQYTYGLFSPLPRKHLNLVGRKVAFAGVNLPPASVWRYRRPHDGDRARAP